LKISDLRGGNMPKRIQRKRTKGWKMPDNTVYVGRPSKWGNNLHDDSPFTRYGACIKNLIENYSGYDINELKGKDLACWCPLDQPCHADVLLKIANKPSIMKTVVIDGKKYIEKPDVDLPFGNVCRHCALSKTAGIPCYDRHDFSCHADSRPDGQGVV